MNLLRRKVLFIIPSLSIGGAEKNFVFLIKNLPKEEFNIEIIVLLNKTTSNTYSLKNFNINYWGFRRTHQSFVALIAEIRKRKPNVVFSTLGHLNIILGLVKYFVPNSIQFIGRETNVKSVYQQYQVQKIFLNFCSRWFYRNLDKIVCTTQYMKEDLKNAYSIPENKIVVIYNPAIPSSKKSNRTSTISEDYFLCISNLKYTKGVDRLLKIVKLADSKLLKLKIIGDGPEREGLKKMTKELGLNSQIDFLGFKKNPSEFFSNAKALLLGSRVEGFPNVILEANQYGIPVIAFKNSGIEEIVKERITGILIPEGNLNQYAETLLNWNEEDFDSAMIKDRVNRKFNPRKILSQYSTLMRNT